MTFETAVAAFHRHYQESVETRPDLYRNGDDMITVVLPKDLLEYSNASAGHSGFGSGARPVGIRRKVRNSEQALAAIFASEDSLGRFILESERDGPAMVEEIKRRHIEKSTPKPVMTSGADGFWSKYSKEDMAKIKTAIKDQKQLVEDFKTMTLADFEIKYKLVDTETV
jgi:hypothetical protein